MSVADFARIKDQFGFGYGPFAASVAWTDTTVDTRSADVTMATGHSSRFGTSEAETCQLTMDNAAHKDGRLAGRYTPGFNAGPYHPLTEGVPFQRQVEYPKWSGTWYPVWAGAAMDFLPGFEGAASGFATSNISQRLALLESITLQRLVRHEILSDNPAGYWPLDDAAGSTSAAESSGNNLPALTVVQRGTGGTIDFGVGSAPGPDDATTCAFAPSGASYKYLSGAGRVVGGAGFTVECFFELAALNDALFAGADVGLAYVVAAGGIVAAGLGGVSLTFATTPVLNAGYHVAYTESVSGTTVTETLYLNGVSVATGTRTSATTNGMSTGLIVGNLGMTGNVSDAAVYTTCLSPTRILAHANAGLNGFDGETADLRFNRLNRYAGIDPSWYTTDGTFTTSIAAQATDGRTIVDVHRELEAAEGGRFMATNTGKLQLRSRAGEYARTVVATLSPGVHFDFDGTFGIDTTGMVNRLRATSTAVSTPSVQRGVGPEQSAQNVTSIARGVKDPGTQTLALTNDSDVGNAVDWLVNTRSSPGNRIPSLVMNAATLHHANMLTAILGMVEGDRLLLGTATDTLPASAPGTFLAVRVDRIEHAFDSDKWTITVACEPWQPVWTVGDADYGRLGPDPGSWTLQSALTATATSAVLLTSGASPVLTSAAGDLPISLDIKGERVLVTAVSGSTSPQTLTITRGVGPSTACAHLAGESINLWNPGVLAL